MFNTTKWIEWESWPTPKTEQNVVSLKTTIQSLKEREKGYAHESSTLENGMNDNFELLQKENDRVLSLNSTIQSKINWKVQSTYQ